MVDKSNKVIVSSCKFIQKHYVWFLKQFVLTPNLAPHCKGSIWVYQIPMFSGAMARFVLGVLYSAWFDFMLKVQKGPTSIWLEPSLWERSSCEFTPLGLTITRCHCNSPSYVGLLTCCVSFQMVHINHRRNGMTSATLVKSNVQVVPCHNPNAYVSYSLRYIFTIEVHRIKPWEQLHPSQLCHSPKPSMAAVFLVATLTLPPLHCIVGTLILTKQWKLLLTHTVSPIKKK